jgi:hypothetical protein
MLLKIFTAKNAIFGPAPPADRWLTEDDVCERLGISRDVLSALLRELPVNLVGAPIRIRGKGKASKTTTQTRYRRRWRAASFGDWADAVRDLQIKRDGLKPPRPKTQKIRVKAPKNVKGGDGAVDWDAPLTDLM